MVERWGADFYKKTHLSGGSAGTIFAIGIALGKSPKFLDEVYRTVAEKSHKHGPVHNASVFMEDAMKILLDDPLAYKKLEGRCCFGTTEFFAKHRWHVSFVDNEDLISCVQASYHIPFYCQLNKGIKGVHVVDGAYGFSGVNLPHGDDTLYVGIDPHAEITRTFTYPQMFLPAVGREYDDMVLSGYEAFRLWDGVTMIKKVGSRTPNYSALYGLWTLKVLEVLIYGLIDFFWFILSFVMSLFGISRLSGCAVAPRA
jgi:hypothetical protein